jgi:ferredoxin
MTPGTTADESGIDARMLAGTPVGGPGGSAACDTCNRRLTDGQRRADDPDAEPDTVSVYATRARRSGTWALRWVSCEACGSPGDGEDLEDGEAVATATLGYDTRIGAFVLEDVRDVEVSA